MNDGVNSRSQTVWSQEPFPLLKFIEDPKQLLCRLYVETLTILKFSKSDTEIKNKMTVTRGEGEGGNGGKKGRGQIKEPI